MAVSLYTRFFITKIKKKENKENEPQKPQNLKKMFRKSPALNT